MWYLSITIPYDVLVVKLNVLNFHRPAPPAKRRELSRLENFVVVLGCLFFRFSEKCDCPNLKHVIILRKYQKTNPTV